MKKQTKLVAVLSTAALLAIGASMTSFAATGWAEEDGTWVYYNRDGERATDSWKKSGNNWYYLDSDGEMAIDQLIEDGDNYYYVDINGVMASNQWVAIENEDAGDDNEPEHYWYYFQANGKALTNGDNTNIALKTINGKKYEFDVNGAMTAEWSLDVEKASNDGVKDGNSTSSTNSVAAKYAKEWRYFSSVEDGARVSKGWFKVVAAEYLNYDKYNDDEDAWYYADGSGNLYAGEFKTIKGKKYAFRDDGRMVSGLKFIKINKDAQNKVTGLTVKADDDDNHPFDDEDRFDESALWYEANEYDCYYFGDGDDGAMRTNKTSVTIDGDNYNFYFEKSGGNKGAGVTGEKDDKYYQNGKLVRAGSDEKYQVVQHIDDRANNKVGYDKLDDAAEVVAAITAHADYDVDTTVSQANLDALGVNKKLEDIQELAVFTRKADNKVGTKVEDFFLVNTSGKVIDSKSKNKDGNDYNFVVSKGGSILGYYVED